MGNVRRNYEPNTKMNLPNKAKEYKVTVRAAGGQDIEIMVTASSYIKAAAQVLEVEPSQVVKVMGIKGRFANMRFSEEKAHLRKSCKVELWNS